MGLAAADWGTIAAPAAAIIGQRRSSAPKMREWLATQVSA
jgi:hypothetical protein